MLFREPVESHIHGSQPTITEKTVRPKIKRGGIYMEQNLTRMVIFVKAIPCTTLFFFYICTGVMNTIAICRLC